MAAFDNDVYSTAIFTATGLLTKADGTPMPLQCRIVGVYYSASVSGTITIAEGNGGAVKLPIPMTASASGLVTVPQAGIRFKTAAPYATVVGTLTGAIVFYVG